MANNYRQLAMRTKKEEGYSSKSYLDTRGNKTVGYGANISDPSVAKLVPSDVAKGARQLTIAEANNLFTKQYETATKDAKSYLGEDVFATLSPSQQSAIVDMAYNMGLPKLSTFKKVKAALQSGNYEVAASEILNSNYGKSETRNRALRNAQLIMQVNQANK